VTAAVHFDPMKDILGARSSRPTGLLAAALALSVLAGPAVRPAAAAEGKWTPEQLLEHDPRQLREMGLEVPPEALWRRDGGGLLEAAVRVDGCSAGFLSEDGLLLTNHHCAFRILQQNSKPGHDLITGGFLAGSRSEELQGSGTRAAIPARRRDVTAEVEGAVPAGADDLARYSAIERKKKELVAACERPGSRRCEVAAFDGGLSYVLIENLEFADVRLVYAPPRAVGEYGGEVDNWSWPRHTGDFALLRVYAGAGNAPAAMPEGNEGNGGNVPYRPKVWFKTAPAGVQPGDFVMLAGYPALTLRSLTAAEMRERAELFHPGRAELYRAWIDLMEAESGKGEAARLALADRIKSLANNEKNSRGQVAGLRRGRTLERKEAAERETLAWAANRPDQAAAVAAHRDLARLAEERRAGWQRDFLLDRMKQGPKPLDLALTLVRWAGERGRPELEREAGFQERDRAKLADQLRADQKRLHGPAEESLLADLLGRFAALSEQGPEGSRLTAEREVLGPAAAERTPEALRARAAALLAGTRVTDLDERLRMFEQSEAELRARRDPLLDLAFALDRELRAAQEREHRREGAISRLRPAWRRAVAAHAGRPVDPDANGTLRVSLAHVKGYEPRDAVLMEPQTTVAGMAEKHTGEEPFDAPAALLRAVPEAGKSRWADPRLGDVPVAFLADADTTGGNSGSPVLNGRGEVVGVNFDRVWENVANDFGYNPDVARNVNADLRYLLWTLDVFHGQAAEPVLRELGLAARN
jgi:Peptidase S46